MYSQRRIDDASYQRILFEWAQPKVSEYCRENGLAYPPLDDSGELIDGLGWQRAVRDGLAPQFDW